MTKKLKITIRGKLVDIGEYTFSVGYKKSLEALCLHLYNLGFKDGTKEELRRHTKAYNKFCQK